MIFLADADLSVSVVSPSEIGLDFKTNYAITVIALYTVNGIYRPLRPLCRPLCHYTDRVRCAPRTYFATTTDPTLTQPVSGSRCSDRTDSHIQGYELTVILMPGEQHESRLKDSKSPNAESNTGISYAPGVI